MFSFLSPLSSAGLWLGALLAVPLLIHFLGRQRLRKVPFPSLMLLQEKFARSMQRHRLKNLLLLILRTLLLLALLIALANPALESLKPKAAGEETAAVLIHNGAYGLLPAVGGGGGGPAGRGNALETQRRRIRALDSLAGAPSRTVALLADGPGLQEAAARFGDYGEALERLLASLDAGAPAARLYVPVFAWADLEPAADALAKALRDRPGLQVMFWDFGDEGARLSPFAAVRSLPSARSPVVKLRAQINPLAPSPAKARVTLDGRILQETQPEGYLAEADIPLSDGARTAGALSLADDGGRGKDGFAVPEWYFCFPNPGRLVLAHAGSALASLPSLGRENYFRRIVHVAEARNLPWGGGGAEQGKAPPGGSPQLPGGSLRLVYLSNERNTDAAAYSRLVEFVKRGGRLIVGVGKESDASMLNRFLLQPLRMGRLGAPIDAAAPTPAPSDRAIADAGALASLGALPSAEGALGAVRKRFAFSPDSGTATLIRTAPAQGEGAGGGIVLAMKDYHQGKVLLWTTDLDDLDWTDLGVSPLVPLIDQAFQEAAAGGLTANRMAESDSVFTLALDDPAARPEILDPDGRPFTRVRFDAGRARIGPFDKLGLHRVILGSDTLAFAVNLAERGPSPFQSEGDWEKWNEGHRAGILKALEAFRGRVATASPEGSGDLRASVRPLWKLLFLAAILLLFMEGLIASAFSMGRQKT